RLVGHVARDAERGAAAALDPVCALLRVRGHDVHADDGCALVGQPLRDATADVGTGSRHDRDLSLERHWITWLARSVFPDCCVSRVTGARGVPSTVEQTLPA